MTKRTRRQKVKDVQAHSDFLDVMHRKVVRNGNSHTIAFGSWLGDWRNVRLYLVKRTDTGIMVLIQSTDKEIENNAQTNPV